MPGDNSVKILFCFFSDLIDEEATEILLAEVVNAGNGYYKLESIPFYASEIALGDMVWAEYSQADKMLVYRKTVEHSGNSTIHAVVLDEEYDLDPILAVFEISGCITDKLNSKYFVIAVPASVNYTPIKRRLDQLKNEKILDYAESCLSEKHQYKNIPRQGHG